MGGQWRTGQCCLRLGSDMPKAPGFGKFSANLATMVNTINRSLWHLRTIKVPNKHIMYLYFLGSQEENKSIIILSKSMTNTFFYFCWTIHIQYNNLWIYATLSIKYLITLQTQSTSSLWNLSIFGKNNVFYSRM